MENVSKSIVQQMLEHALIKEDERIIFEYSLQVLLEQIITYGTVIILSLIFRNTCQTIFHIIIFSSLRKHTGGFHLNTFQQCYISSVTLYIIYSVIIFPLLEKNEFVNWVLFVCGTIVILIIGAVNNENINWDEDEFRRSALISRVTVSIEAAVIIALNIIGIRKDYILYMCYGIILCSILLFINIMQRRCKQYEEN